ncbi:tail protein [Escherichia phage vB_EcoS_FFH_1]|uniref:Putative tail fiber protein n=1 Tax=Escherichia phage vB_EcoS_FFH_1 TaxID=1446489 RepID=A0A023MH85_9CAUD|nr:tail protein [Escherichia phage vB_EcoS_FFH_1]AHN83565.1 putative tail fiber protein [Escherichia phage vB_EcoS_FFH_1]
MAITTKIIVQQILNIDDTKTTASKFPRYTVTLGNSISSITANELVSSIEAAAKSAAAAKDSEVAAKTSELNAKESENDAAISAGASEASATQSATSATQSAASANKSAESAAAAKTSETNSKTSEANAKTSETNAKTSETNADASAAAAKISETNAKASETNAAQSAADAKLSEGNAKVSETNAAQSADDSSGFRNEAEIFSGQAAASASAAKISETNAKTSETKAKASETNAAGSATSASQSVAAIQGLKSDVEQLKSDTQAIKNSAVTETTALKADVEQLKSDTQAIKNSAVSEITTLKADVEQLKTDTQGIKDSAVSDTTALKNQAAASATQAGNSAIEAGQQASNAAGSANSSKAEADRAKAEADRAEIAANRAPDLQPFPDVWIPFNDSLDMLAGYSPGYKKITVGADVITMPSDKVVSFSRASNATYINKHGEFCIANIDEPRFEKQGLLIEGQRTNHITFSNDPASLNTDKYRSDVTYNVDKYGFAYATATANEKSQGEYPPLFYCETVNAINCQQNEYVSLSIRVKANLDIYITPQFYLVGEDGGLILGARSFINCETGEVSSIVEGRGTIAHRIYREDNGWLKVEAMCKFVERGGSSIGSVNYCRNNDQPVQVGDTISFCTPQFEKGFCASSFIITGSTPATRALDYVTIPARNNFSGLNISFLVEVSTNWDSFQLDNTYPMIIDNNRYNTAGESFVSEVVIGTRVPSVYFLNKETGTSIGSNGSSFSGVGVPSIWGFIHTKDGDVTSFLNGLKNITSSGSTWEGLPPDSLLEIGGRPSDSTKLYGHVRNLRIWNRVLTDSQMREKV